jgi:hypothetical protein
MTVNPIPISVAQPVPEMSDNNLSNDALARRKARMGKAGW